MNLSPSTQAILLLNSYFSSPEQSIEKPLSIAEWAKFALWLKNRGEQPADLLSEGGEAILSSWEDEKISSERLSGLLRRGHSLALAMEKWQRAGLWVITRSDRTYPWRLKQKLKNSAPPVLFGCGNPDLLNSRGIAVIGSRNATDTDLNFAAKTAENATLNGLATVSGGAKGIDESAMVGALKVGGQSIGVMADNLLKASTSNKWRKALMQGDLVLISPFYPESSFNVGNAMARNKYIYCLADTALVVHSGIKGGTWSGAVENLKQQWTPLWVKASQDSAAGNDQLIAKGGIFLAAENVDVKTLFDSPVQLERQQAELFTLQPEEECLDFFQLFIKKMKLIARTPKTLDDVLEETSLTKTQASEWLKKAVQEEKLVKLSHPVRFQWKQ